MGNEEVQVHVTITLKEYKELLEIRRLGGNKMCEYCKEGKSLKSANFCGSAKLRISISKEWTMLEVQGDENKFHLFKRIYCPRFTINYCPMCGRILGDDK